MTTTTDFLLPGAHHDLRAAWYNQPLMVSDAAAEYMRANARVPMSRAAQEGQQAGHAVAFGGAFDAARARPYRLEDGVAVINIKGMLEHDSRWYCAYWTGYDAIRARFDMAEQDPEVSGIALLINSGGGMVSGNFDLVDHIRAGAKPTLAIVDEHAYSAAYSLASAADRIAVARTGGVGSIGVLSVHFDFSKALDNMGINAEIIRAGKHKAKPNMLEPMESATRARLQASIEDTYTLFIDTVARNRGLDPEAVRNTEAATFGAEEGVALGLADVVQAPLEALAAFKQELSGSSTNGVFAMTQTNHAQGAGANSGQANTTTGITQDQLNQAVAEAKAAGKAEGEQAGREAGATEERERIFAIIGCDEAEGREAAALSLAENPAISAEQAAKTLGALPKTEPGSGNGKHSAGNLLDDAMSQTGGGAGVGAGEGGDDGHETAVIIDADAIYARENQHAN